jgi:hypothetical protein
MAETKSESSREAEHERLRLELLRRIVKSETERKAKPRSVGS